MRSKQVSITSYPSRSRKGVPIVVTGRLSPADGAAGRRVYLEGTQRSSYTLASAVVSPNGTFRLEANPGTGTWTLRVRESGGWSVYSPTVTMRRG